MKSRRGVKELMFITFLFIMVGVVSEIAKAEVLIGTTIEGSLVISDTDAACIEVTPNSDFKWAANPGQLMSLNEFTRVNEVTDLVGSDALALCDSLKKPPIVAKNKKRPDRPMKDDNYKSTGDRVRVYTVCETKLIKPYRPVEQNRGYYYTTNRFGVRGLAICSVPK